MTTRFWCRRRILIAGGRYINYWPPQSSNRFWQAQHLTRITDSPLHLVKRIIRHLKWRWDTLVVRPCRAIYHFLVPSEGERYRLEKMVGPIGFWNELQEYQFSFLRRMHLEPHHTLADIGCGPLQGGIPLIDYLAPGHYVGIDIRNSAVIEAYKQVAKAGLVDKNPRLIVSSTFGREEIDGRKFDFVWISQLLYHFSPSEVRECVRQVSHLLKQGGRCFGDIIGYPNTITPETRWDGYRFYLHTFEFLEEVSQQCGLRMRHLGQIGNFGYPEEIDLKTNDVLEFTKPLVWECPTGPRQALPEACAGSLVQPSG